MVTFGKRYFVAWMCCLANCIFYCNRLNLNIAIVEMVYRNESGPETTQSGLEQTYKNEVLQKRYKIPAYNWDEMTKQTILGAFYYGYAVMPLPWGWLAYRVGGKKVVGLAVIVTSLLAASIPWFSSVSVGLLITSRILDGLVQGASIPATYVILGKWTVPTERSTMVTISFSGMNLGLIVSSFLSGWICSAYRIGGWPMSFYTYSILGVIWTLLWSKFVYETPNEDPYISTSEREYITKCMEQDCTINEITPVPWCDIISSSAVWAIIVSYTALDYALYFIITEIPSFLSIFGFEVQTVGELISLMYFVGFPIMILAGVCADWIIQKDILNVINTRRMFIIIVFGVSGACHLGISFSTYNALAIVALLLLAFTTLSLEASCITANVLDISTQHAAIITGIMSTLSSCTGFIGPFIVASLGNENKIEHWTVLFMISAGIQLFGMVFFLIFAKAEEQHW